MRNLIQIAQAIPIFLVTAYFGFYFCINLQEYADIHEILSNIDNILVTISLLTFSLGGYKLWNKIALRSLSAIILLNIITELEIENYYFVYSLIMQAFLVTIILATTPRFKWI